MSSAERRGRWAWLGVLALLLVPSVLVGSARAMSLDVLAWVPALAWTQPWRWWSAAWVHLSDMHLRANVLGALMVGVLGWVAAVPPRAAWAWALAWPLTHLALWFQPALVRYGGLSGVLHAGVAVVVLSAWWTAPNRASRAVAAVLGLGLVLKVLLERPWAQVLTHPPGWDIAVAPAAHAAGLCVGAACAWLVLRPVLPRAQRRP